MNITQAIKDELIHSMVRHASKRQAAATGKAAKSLDKLWRQLFAKHIELKIPEVPQARWAPLIQEGIFNSMKGEIYVVKPLEGNSHRDTDNVSVGLVKMGYSGNMKEREADAKKWQAVRQAVESEWGVFLNFTGKHVGSYDFSYSWKTSHADLPSVRGLSHIFAPGVTVKEANKHQLPYSNAAYPLTQQVDRLMEAYMDVLKAASAMYDDLTTILTSVRTLKQLEEQFPDAVQFLPEEFTKKVRNTKQVADPALVNRAKEMLISGIPN